MASARYARTAVVVGLLGSVALLGSVVAAEAAVAQLRCATSGKTIRANKVARVFTIRHPGSRIYYGCSRDTGRVHRLIRVPFGSEHLEHPRLTGRYFAAEWWHNDLNDSVIAVWSVRRRGEIWSGAAGHEEFAEDVEVTRRGAVAWLGTGVLKCDRNGRAEIGGADGTTVRLKRIGRTIYWRSEGKKHSYLLRGRASYRAC